MKKKVLQSVFMLTLLLSSCTFGGVQTVDGACFYIPNDLKYTFRDVNSQLGWVTSKTVGTQKLLVIPVQLGGAKEWTLEMINNLNIAFFGKTEETKYESVKSFFQKSSYGNLILEGEVASPLVSSYSVTQLDKYGTEAPDYIIDEYYAKTNADIFKNYDFDDDGFVDNAIFIYSNDYNIVDENTAYWAWCYAHSFNSNINKPTINNYMWASYSFMEDKYVDGYRNEYVDTHTYIHEVGHLLGLDDYYCYDSNNSWDCAGKLEMQSYNIGDHNIFSKLALGWVKPYVITNSSTIKLKTSSKYPEAILINDKWNGSAFDEYILIEYYTPTGLNEQDAKHLYENNTQMYNYSGLRIYHVDARIARLKADSEGNAIFDGYSDTIETNNPSKAYFVGASNSYSYSYLPENTAKIYRYLHLLDQGELNILNNGQGGKIFPLAALWTGTKTFKPSKKFFANNTKFNSGENIGYSVQVGELNDEECTVTIKRI